MDRPPSTSRHHLPRGPWRPPPPQQPPLHHQQNPPHFTHHNQNPIPARPPHQHHYHYASRMELLERIERAVIKARRDLLAAGENVSAWSVSKAALLAMKVDSWESLGFTTQGVASLRSIMAVEGKVNAFIQCFVGARQITSLHDLEMAICRNEGIENFEELELGPFLRHPLVLYYFSLSADVTEVVKITSEEIVSYLGDFMLRCKKRCVEIEEFLDYIARKKSTERKEKLGIRIQSLELHISVIFEARKSEDDSLRKSVKQKMDEKRGTIPCAQPDDLSSPLEGNFVPRDMNNCPLTSDDEDVDHSSDENKCDFDQGIKMQTSRTITCALYSGAQGSKESTVSQNFSIRDWLKEDIKERDRIRSDPANYTKTGRLKKKNGLIHFSDLRIFIKNWKDLCRAASLPEVFDMMIEEYVSPKRKRKGKMQHMLLQKPFLQLVNVAIVSIKSGILDDIYNSLAQERLSEICTKTSDCESSNLALSEMSAPVISETKREDAFSFSVFSNTKGTGVNIDDIVRKVSEYMQLNHKIMVTDLSVMQNRLFVLKKLFDCEAWLTEQFSVAKFELLGHGDYLNFLEEQECLLPPEMLKILRGNIHEKSQLEVCMLQQQLVELVAQALNGLWESETVTEQMISALLVSQFPFLTFKIDGSIENLLKSVGLYRNNAISKCVVFSKTLMAHNDVGRDLSVSNNEGFSHAEERGIQISVESLSRNDPIEVLLQAPMLEDLNTWSHWDVLFAPTLGPLVGWLLNEVNRRDFLCLASKDGMVIRIDHSASMSSFPQMALQGSPFQMAVQLLSLLSLHGGEKHVPCSLLKSHVRHAFEVLFFTNSENKEKTPDYSGFGKASHSSNTGGENASYKLYRDCNNISDKVSLASRFFLDCLGYLPAEFRAFAADILLFGMRNFVTITSVILSECKVIAERIMLHEVGFSLGILEWIEDYKAFCSTTANDSYISCKDASSNNDMSELSGKFTRVDCDVCQSSSLEGDKNISFAEGQRSQNNEVCCTLSSQYCMDEGLTQTSNEHCGCEDASLVIECIRREEFGLDPSLSNDESSLLKKQHVRLGRALHFLSQELYSQDSHFILELVQNADDNTYSENVEPTLSFILQESGIIILNNERGFSAQNIRALCDVGNSTKKGKNTGYIGKKGIGFKSVFRVTDSPEIHSNGFHVKFDISEGEIGFVLPTVIAPCDVNSFSRLVLVKTDSLDTNCWKTCIVLPFNSKMLEGTASGSVIAMFSDLHPSLLLFLHRLKSIRFRNMFNGSLIVMRKEDKNNGIVKVSCGEKEMNWFVASQNLETNATYRDVQSTEIALAFTLQELEDGSYSPVLDPQPVFSFLPLRTYGLRFILQGDFILSSSREEIDGNNPWNQWLLSEFPNLFVNAERQFCALPCFNNNLGEAVTAYMSYIPLVNEVHGFFSGLPRMIISRLHQSNCLLLEGDDITWVPPCRVLRNWNKRARNLLNEQLLKDHLGLGFLNKDIILSDQLARMLGIEDYSPKALLQILKSLSLRKNGLQSIHLSWLSAWLNEVYAMYPDPSTQVSRHSESDDEILRTLRKLPFIPLSDGTFGSLDDGAIWLQSDAFNIGMDNELAGDIFPNLYAKLRIVDHALFTAKDATDFCMHPDFCMDASFSQNIISMLFRIGVQRLSSHEILKVHILPAISNDRNAKDIVLMTEFLCFLLVHLQSNCPRCHSDRDLLMSELRNKAFILTNHGLRNPNSVPIHFGKEFGNFGIVNKLITNICMEWHEVDVIYLTHPSTKSLLHGRTKWKKFLREIGVTDFVQVVQVDKKISNTSHRQEKDLMIATSVAKDWESPELDYILTYLSTTGDRSSCKVLLELLDIMWDDSYSDKAVGYYDDESGGDRQCFQSSFMKSICDARWVVSNMDGELHSPADLFYDCDAIRSILGSSAPYAVPKVKSEKLLDAIGFKTKVTIEDVVEILKIWRRSGSPFKASIAQMSRLYAFMWKEIDTSKQALIEELFTGPFIYVPLSKDFGDEELVSGSFLSPKEVCWHDSTGCLGQIEDSNQPGFVDVQHEPLSKTLCNVYPGLHDFFVNTCGVYEIPSFTDYFQILLHVSSSFLPTQSANRVLRVFLKLAEILKSAKVQPEDVSSIKQHLQQPDFTVLPSCRNKWVSLHPSFGLVCWSDDENLVEEFKHLDKVELLHFGELDEDGKEMFSSNMPVLMQTLVIPALSEVVSREAIYYGPVDSTIKASLVDWALSYAQRYIYHIHPEAYAKLKLSGFSDLKRLNVVVVEKLFYRSVIKNVGIASKKRFEISSLLQDNTLFVTPGSDNHALFMEVSRVFTDKIPELNLANFLHMITTMAESGSTEEQVEYFVINNQKVLRLPDDESIWTLPSVSSLIEHDESPQTSSLSAMIKFKGSLYSKKTCGSNSSWSPANWKAASNLSGSSLFEHDESPPTSSWFAMTKFETPLFSKKTGGSNSRWPSANWKAAPNPGGSYATQILKQAAQLGSSEKVIKDDDNDFVGEIKSNLEANLGDLNEYIINQPVSDSSVSKESGESTFVCDIPEMDSFYLEQRNELNIGTPDATQTMLVGRLGECVVFRHFTKKLGSASVKWVNQGDETGLPYDITIRNEGKGLCYIEVKATQSEGKDWFTISAREWKFAAEKGDSYWVVHVVLGDEAKFRIFRDPVELCSLGKLQLAIVMPKEHQVQD